MAVRVTVETASRAEAELVAEFLRPDARAESSRGRGVIRLGLKSERQTAEVIEAVGSAVEQHQLAWARVRYDDDERVFRGNGRHVQPTPTERRRDDPGRPRPDRAEARGQSLVDEIVGRVLSLRPGPADEPRA